MMKPEKRKLTLDRTAIYQVKIPGMLDECWTDWDGEMTVSVDTDEDGLVYTTLTGALDQAALQGLLRRLYGLGLPLISVICLGVG